MITKYVVGARIKPGDFLSFFNKELFAEEQYEVDTVISCLTSETDVVVTFKGDRFKGLGCTFDKRRKVRVRREK